MTTTAITARHKLLDGKVQLYIRAGSPHWQCSCTIAGRQKRTTTKEESLARAKDVARDWYLGLLGKYRQGDIKEGTPFTKAADQFLAEYGAIMEGERNDHYIKSHGIRLRKHLTPFFGDKMMHEITPGLVQEYRAHRMLTGVARDGVTPQRPARNTLHQEIITLRHVLKTAERHGWLDYLPNISPPYKASGKISHRAWFSPEEYKQLYKATGDRAKNPIRERWRSACEDLHDYVLFMVNSGLRPDEAKRIEVRDVEVAVDGPDKQRIFSRPASGHLGPSSFASSQGIRFFAASLTASPLRSERVRRTERPASCLHMKARDGRGQRQGEPP